MERLEIGYGNICKKREAVFRANHAGCIRNVKYVESVTCNL